MVDPELRVEDGARAGRAVVGEPRRDVRAVRRPAGMDRLRRRPVGEVGEDPRRHRAGDAERPRGRRPRRSRRAARPRRRRRRHRRSRWDGSRGRGTRPAPPCRSGRRPRCRRRSRRARRARRLRRAPRRRRLPARSRWRRASRSPSACRRSRGRDSVIALAKAALAAGSRSSRPITVAWALAAELAHRRPTFDAVPGRVRCEPAAERVEDVELRVLDHLRRDVVEADGRREGGDRLGCGHVTPSTRRRYRGTCPAPRARRACTP